MALVWISFRRWCVDWLPVGLAQLHPEVVAEWWLALVEGKARRVNAETGEEELQIREPVWQ